MRFLWVYRCRLCGEEFSALGPTRAGEEIRHDVRKMEMNTRPWTVRRLVMHKPCPQGIGIAEVIGARPVGEDDERTDRPT